MAGWLACTTSTDLIIQVTEGLHVDHLLLMFSHQFINTIYFLCLKTVDSNPTDEFPTFLAVSATVDRYFNLTLSHLSKVALLFYPHFSCSLVGIKDVAVA